MKANQHEKEMFEKFWIDKVDMVTFQSFQPPNDSEDFSKFYPDDVPSLKNKLNNENLKKIFKCPQPFQRVVIRNDNITACCNTFSNQLSLGKLNEGIYKAWNSPLANELRRIHRCGKYFENPTCKKCVETTSS